ncbi:TIR-like protein FxsC [Actinomadura sp. WMMA1423]|uniref:TIR-like protein FxsC n=1 Tax=Actinomadura sp. WMMA1423 TaxID=2591108 RepID=UPI0011476A6C|nr:TIR-like protein FxsC [Actinomadura sp. WMMA1423]
MSGRSSPENERPQFFLSYARSRFQPEVSGRWVTQFFDDLCQDVGQTMGVSNPGFMDRQIPVGVEWSDRLKIALSNCRIFVALFSPAYFESDYCGREWAAFQRRCQAQALGQNPPSAIIPAFWVPMELDELPSSVHSIQNTSPGFPEAYAAEGLYGIMKLSRYREDYEETVLRLARLIKERAAECDLMASSVSALEALQSPFTDTTRARNRPIVRLTLAAQQLDQLPRGRDAYYYGRTALEWTPYRDHDHLGPIGAYAQEVLEEMGHGSIVDGIDDAAQDPAEEPGVLVVDPWAAKDPVIGKRLRQMDRDPVNLLAPFNSEDHETMTASADLAEGLTEVLPRSTALIGSATRLASINAFRDALPKAVHEAVSRYFKTTEVHPPQTPPTMSRPSLQGPES